MAMEEKEIMKAPAGMKFSPDPRESIKKFLLKKVTREQLSFDYVKDIDVFADPEIWMEDFQRTGLQTLHFFTKKDKGKRIARSTEFGTWKAQKNDEVEDYDIDQKKNIHIGSKRSLSFVAKNGFELDARYTMHEYRLDGIYKNTPKLPENDDYVFCQINKLKKQKKLTRDNSHQVEDVGTSKNLEPLPLISEETSTSQIRATIKTPHLDFSDTDGAEVISMDNASHYVPPLNMEQDEDFQAHYNGLFVDDPPHWDFGDPDWSGVICMDFASHNLPSLNMEQDEDSEAFCKPFFA